MKVITVATLQESYLGDTKGKYLGSFTQVKLAFEFIERHKWTHDRVLWIQMERGGKKPASLSRINKALRSSGATVLYVADEVAYAIHLSEMNPPVTERNQ